MCCDVEKHFTAAFFTFFLRWWKTTAGPLVSYVTLVLKGVHPKIKGAYHIIC